MRSVLTLLTFAVAGCAYTNPGLSSALAPAANIGTYVDCTEDGCREKWERAQVWLAKHSKWKIQTATDVLLQTYNPTDYKPEYGFQVVREPRGDGAYRITIALSCGNAFGCSPRADDVRNAFVYYVMFGKDLLDGQATGGAIRD